MNTSAFSGVSARASGCPGGSAPASGRPGDRLRRAAVSSKAPVNPRTVLVRHGVDHRALPPALDPATPSPTSIAQLPRPIIGFFGLIADWVDVELMASVAGHFAHGSLVVLGKATTDVSAL